MQITNSKNDELLDLKDFANLLRITPKTLQNWLGDPRKELPKGFRLGNSPTAPRRWTRLEASDWIREQQQRQHH